MNLNMSGTVEVTLDSGEKYPFAGVVRAENVDGELTLYRANNDSAAFGPGTWVQAIPVGP